MTRDASRVALIGVLSAALYAATYWAQGAMFRNGLRVEFGSVLVRGEPADVARLLLQSGVYYGATVGLFALFAWLLVLCRRGLMGDVRARRLALLFPVLFNAGLLLCLPYESYDAFTYVAHGHLGNLPDADPNSNPYATAVREVGHLDFARDLASYGWLPVHGPSPYGPLWTHVEIAAVWAMDSVFGALLFMKAVIVAASLGSALCVWKILGRVRPEDQLIGTLFYLWNPVIVYEFAAEGHNDALMVLCALLSLALTVAARPAFSAAALALGVLVKYVPVVFLPAQLVYLWHTRRSASRLALGLLAGALISVGLAVALYGPLWVGMGTLDGVRAQGQPSFSPSPSGWLYGYLAVVLPPAEAARLTLRILGAAFVLFVLFVSWRARDAAGLLRACAGISLFYVFVLSTGYWPWYATLPLAFMALVPRGILLPLAFVLALCSRLVAPVNNLWVNGFIEARTAYDITTAVGVTVPFSVLLFLLMWRLSRRIEAARARKV